MNMPKKENDIKSPMIVIIKYWIIRIKVALPLANEMIL